MTIMRTLVAIYLTMLSYCCAAQRFLINVGAGVGTYSMTDMKTLQSELKEQLPAKATVTDEFPSYFYYEASGHWLAGKSFFTGLAVAYGSTGGRAQYQDYSGYIRTDQLLKYVNVSVPVGFAIHPKEMLSIHFDLKPTYTFTITDLKFDEAVLSLREVQTLRFTSSNIAAQPGLMLIRTIRQFAVSAQASYYVTVVKGKMYYKENNEAFLIDTKGDPLHATWDGLRLSLGVSLFLGE